jgi:hypothetical protein
LCQPPVQLLFKIYGGGSEEKVRFKSEADFFAAIVVNKTFDFQVNAMR